MLRFLYPLGLFLSALLFFSIQPMVAKVLLPIYGGTPAVWTVCMLFFQLILLVSYSYAWLLSLTHKPRVWRSIHTLFILLSCVSLPLVFQPTPMDGLPELTILYHLITQLGLPILIIAASAPLLQFAYSQTNQKGATDPYFLYSASNIGSLIALISYPWVFERFIGITVQFKLWNIGFFCYLGLLLFILYTVRYTPLDKKNAPSTQVAWRDILYWVFLSFIPCSLMLGVTLYITTDVAATPLFWVLPLALYLLTFILAFTEKPFISQEWLQRNCMFFLAFTLIGFILEVGQLKIWQVVLANLSSFFILALLCHTQLFQKRPKPQHLTLFYFCLALGGVLAGIFNGLLAPHWFNQVYEYPLAILLSLFILPLTKTTEGWWVPIAVLALLVLHYLLPTNQGVIGIPYSQIPIILGLALALIWQKNKKSLFLSALFLFICIFSPTLQNKNILAQTRSFYGVSQVVNNNGVNAFISQSTLHGLQSTNQEDALNGFTSYYGALKPVIEAMQYSFQSIPATVIGLGIGTVACQFRKTDPLKIIEIDQQVIDIAKNSKLFTYLRDCPPPIEIIKNDGRLALNQIAQASQKVLILDAFNSDSVPVHLMTLEAFTLYKEKITEDGIILVDITNRHLQLLPVVNAVARSLDMITLYIFHKGDPKLGQLDSYWALITRNEPLALQLVKETNWRFLADNKQFLWTDDYTNLIPLLRW